MQEIDEGLMKYVSMDILEFIKKYMINEDNDISLIKPLSEKIIEEKIANFPNELKKIYRFTNGFSSLILDVLPIFDLNNPKKTWNSIDRANSLNTPFRVSQTELEKFCIFAKVRSSFAQALLFEKGNFIWCYQDINDGEIKRTNMTLIELLLINLQEYNY